MARSLVRVQPELCPTRVYALVAGHGRGMLRIERTRSLADLGRGAVAAVGLCTITVSGIVIAVDSAAQRSVIVPLGQRGYGFPPWLAGPLHDLGGTRLTAPQYGLWVLLMAVGYLLVVANSRFLRTVPTLATIALLQLVFMLTPPLGSTDATNYIAYARLGALSGLSPYSHTPADAPWDPSFTWATWPHYSSPYGPLFTLIAYAFAPLGLAATGWAFKVLFTAASAGCLALVWRCARLLGRPPLAAVAFVGLSPAWLIWSVGGAHNDALMELLVLLAIFMSLTSREAVSGAAAVAAVAIKAPAALLLPFLAIAGRRRPLLIGSAAAAVAVALATVLAFGSLEPFTAFRHQASFASTRSVIGQ